MAVEPKDQLQERDYPAIIFGLTLAALLFWFFGLALQLTPMAFGFNEEIRIHPTLRLLVNSVMFLALSRLF